MVATERRSKRRLNSKGREILSNERFEALVNKYSQQVLNTALHILGNVELAKDVHQEVFLAIWRRWHKYDGQTNWNGYLYRATVRKAIEFAKRSRIESLIEPLEYPAARQSPDGPLRTAELQQRLGQCLAGLSKRQVDVFVLSRIEGLKNEKIAELLCCSQKTVRVHLHRAIKRLADELGDYMTQ